MLIYSEADNASEEVNKAGETISGIWFEWRWRSRTRQAKEGKSRKSKTNNCWYCSVWPARLVCSVNLLRVEIQDSEQFISFRTKA